MQDTGYRIQNPANKHAGYSIQNTANKHAGIQGHKDAGYKDAKDTGYRNKATPRSLVAPLSRGRRIYIDIYISKILSQTDIKGREV